MVIAGFALSISTRLRLVKIACERDEVLAATMGAIAEEAAAKDVVGGVGTPPPPLPAA